MRLNLSPPKFATALLTVLVLSGCGQNESRKKELELKEREIAVKERELALKEKTSPAGNAPITNNTESISSPKKDNSSVNNKPEGLNRDAISPDVKVNIYERTNVLYDSEGWPVEMGKVELVKSFQNNKEYRLKGYNYIETIEVAGHLEDITLQFINAKDNKTLFEEKRISLNGIKTYSTSDPKGEKHNNYQKWLNTKFDGLVMKVIHKDRIVFEGKIIPAK